MPETSIRDDLAAAGLGADDPSATTVSTPDTTAPEGVSGDPIPLEAPKHWAEADRTVFVKAPREIQQRWLSREDEVQKGFSKHGQELARYKKDMESYDEVFKPLDQDLKLNGLSRHQFTKQLVEWNNYLAKDPSNALRAIAERFGVDLKSLTQGTPQTDPQLAGVLNKVGSLEQQLKAREQAEREATMKANHDRVTAFADAKGQDGKPQHPFFDDVAEDVIKLLRAGERDLEVAYKKAVRMNDDVYAKFQAEQTKAQAEAKDREQKARVDKAKRAAVGSEGEGTGSTKPKTLRDDLAAGFAGWGVN
jgi:hypothetical protein